MNPYFTECIYNILTIAAYIAVLWWGVPRAIDAFKAVVDALKGDE